MTSGRTHAPGPLALRSSLTNPRPPSAVAPVAGRRSLGQQEVVGVRRTLSAAQAAAAAAGVEAALTKQRLKGGNHAHHHK